MSNDLGFQMEDRDSPVVDDPSVWGNIAEFVVEHPQAVGCGRPAYVRATVGYARGMIEIVGKEDTWWQRFCTKLYQLFPIFFGGKVVLCSACQNMAFVSPFQEKVWTFIQSLRTEEAAKMLVLYQDVQYIPEEKVQKMKSDA